MLRLRNIIPVAAAIVLLTGCTGPSRLPAIVAPAEATDAPPWRPVDAGTGRIVDIDGLAALAADFPDSASVQRRLLSAGIREQDATTARRALQRLEAMGYALSPAAFDALAPVIGDAEAQAASARAEPLRHQAGVSAVFAEVPADRRLIEGLAWDSVRNRLYLSSVVDRRLYRMDGGGSTAVNGLDGGSLAGLAIDEPRQLLWVASGVVEQTPDPEGAFRGLIALDLASTVPVKRVAAPDGVSLSDIGLAPDGSVFASDPLGGGLYRLRPGAEEIEVLVAPGRLRSPQGIAVHPSGHWLYVADYAYGIAIVDTGSGAVTRLAAPEPMMLDGIDGLYWFDGGLVGIQNGTSPMRIVRISLGRTGSVATGLTVVEANHPDWGEPTNGQVVVNDLLYISRPQWERFGPGGKLKGSEPLRPNPIRATPLRDQLVQPPSR
jgi:hypothetical protein